MPTFKQLQDRVLDLIDESSSVMRTRVQDYINDGSRLVGYEREWPWRLSRGLTFTTTSGIEVYPLGATVHRLIPTIRDTTNDRYLLETNYVALIQRDPDQDDSTGIPTHWYPSGKTAADVQRIGLYPVPNGAYVIEYDFYRTIPDLSSDADVPLMPTQWHSLLVDYAMWKILLREEDSRYAIYQRDFLNNLAIMRSAEGVVSTSPRRMGWTIGMGRLSGVAPTRDGPNV